MARINRVRKNRLIRSFGYDLPPALLPKVLRDWNTAVSQGGDILVELARGKTGQLGDVEGADAQDPTWVASPPSLQFSGSKIVELPGAAAAERS